MKISELITKLSKLQAEHGDINVKCNPDDGAMTHDVKRVEFYIEVEREREAYIYIDA